MLPWWRSFRCCGSCTALESLFELNIQDESVIFSCSDQLWETLDVFTQVKVITLRLRRQHGSTPPPLLLWPADKLTRGLSVVTPDLTWTRAKFSCRDSVTGEETDWGWTQITETGTRWSVITTMCLTKNKSREKSSTTENKQFWIYYVTQQPKDEMQKNIFLKWCSLGLNIWSDPGDKVIQNLQSWQKNSDWLESWTLTGRPRGG